MSLTLSWDAVPSSGLFRPWGRKFKSGSGLAGMNPAPAGRN